jgi:hypothetical protein
MRPSRVYRHHPLAAAGSALEHVVLRHFGFHVIRSETKERPDHAPNVARGAPHT